ncbi:MAG: hypothetical protein K6G07_00375 [Lachnospiraceae bacterium]|nr:hypothetical protein [Lachnospiraceae bacterium]
MSKEQKTLRILAIIQMVMGAIYVVEGILVPSVKASFYVSGGFVLLTGLMCFVAVNDASKATAAKILLWTMIVINLAGAVLAVIGGSAIASVATTCVTVCIACYMVKLIKTIHG